MKEKRIFHVSLVIMIATILLMLINLLIVPFPDWSVRVIGIIMLINIVVLTYSSMRMNQAK